MENEIMIPIAIVNDSKGNIGLVLKLVRENKTGEISTYDSHYAIVVINREHSTNFQYATQGDDGYLSGNQERWRVIMEVKDITQKE